jgi:glycosyltransferase involved in cell wall biosynthesis
LILELQSIQPLFSVLIANYNNGQYLEDCLKSIFAQTYEHWEIIIVDDASTDNSREIYQKYANDQRIRVYYNSKNKGCGYTKRKCVEYASGEICGFVDPDDAILPDSMNIMIKAHLENSECSIISSKFYYTDIKLNIINEGTFGAEIPKGESYLTFGNYAITHFATFKIIAYLNTEGINPELKVAVDQDLYYKLEEVGNTHFIDQFLYKYRATPQSISLNENAIRAITVHEQVFKKAFKRRNKHRTIAVNLNRSKYRIKIYNFRKARIYYSAKSGKYNFKYYLLIQLMIMFPFKDIKYKAKCFLFPSYG